MSDAALRSLVAGNPGQATVEEYRMVDAVLRREAPCRMLVFGLGRDAAYWIGVNAGGRTAFLEDDPVWIERIRREVPGLEVHQVRYRYRRVFWPLLRRRPEKLGMELPAPIRDTDWDVVLVDGPIGNRWYRRGRMQSVYTAAQLGKRSGADLFVHDCHRTVEREACDQFCRADFQIGQVGSMRHYQLG